LRPPAQEHARNAARRGKCRRSGPRLVGIPRQPRAVDPAADKRRDAVPDRENAPRRCGKVESIVKAEDEEQDRDGVVEDPGGDPAPDIVRAEDGAAAGARQDEGVEEQRGHRKDGGLAPRQDAQQKRPTHHGDVDGLALRFREHEF
jgi:hypothetical protein